MRASDIVTKWPRRRGSTAFTDIRTWPVPSLLRQGSPRSSGLTTLRVFRERAEAGGRPASATPTAGSCGTTGGINGGVHFAPDVTNASRTNAYGYPYAAVVARGSPAQIFSILMSMLPEIKSSSEIYAAGRKNVCLVDTPTRRRYSATSRRATFGQACFE